MMVPGFAANTRSCGRKLEIAGAIVVETKRSGRDPDMRRGCARGGHRENADHRGGCNRDRKSAGDHQSLKLHDGHRHFL